MKMRKKEAADRVRVMRSDKLKCLQFQKKNGQFEAYFKTMMDIRALDMAMKELEER